MTRPMESVMLGMVPDEVTDPVSCGGGLERAPTSSTSAPLALTPQPPLRPLRPLRTCDPCRGERRDPPGEAGATRAGQKPRPRRQACVRTFEARTRPRYCRTTGLPESGVVICSELTPLPAHWARISDVVSTVSADVVLDFPLSLPPNEPLYLPATAKVPLLSLSTPLVTVLTVRTVGATGGDELQLV